MAVLTRITADPAVLGGVPCLRGLRISVATVVSQIADGLTPDAIRAAYSDLESDDIPAALAYAASLTS